MSGEHDSLFGKADALLQSSGHPLYPKKRVGNYSMASLVEAKYAAWMKSNDITHAIVVINILTYAPKNWTAEMPWRPSSPWIIP
ncbi:DddA-like double-stranded DNA deaminase toxin [Streptomyces sp. NPDC091292]|uniref:DddA-like double-stranded DNA deaminase toxin n=1 Tax=Streptomyces sp. NPDC091292 TaxID=3365991 RepID=UPI0038088014